MSIEYKQKAHLINYIGNRCLQNDYYHNHCDICQIICPENAFVMDRNKLKLLDDQCTNCAACVGSCPSEAIYFDAFDSNLFTTSFAQMDEKELNCKKNTPCLSVFDHYHFVTMIMEAKEDVILHLETCASCLVNKDDKVKQSIEDRVSVSNDFLRVIGIDHRLKINIEYPVEEKEKSKILFKKIFKQDIDKKQMQGIIPFQSSSIKGHKERVPLKYQIFKSTLKKELENLPNTSFPNEKSELITYKNIDFNSCTLCGDCITFCPTDAFFSSTDKQGIFFSAGKCIDCDICHGVCKPFAVQRVSQGFDLVDIAYDRAKELVHYEMALCQECKCSYPYKGGEQVCDRCVDVRDEMEEMMLLARDMLV